MPRRRTDFDLGSGISHDDTSIGSERATNTAYMRKWRADATNRMRERARRTAAYRERKSRVGRINQGNPASDPVVRICAICGTRRSIGQITRLRLCNSSPSGFEEVLIPYCGKC